MADSRQESPTIRFGVHYEYPSAERRCAQEWLPRSREDWHRDLGVVKETGFSVIRVRVGHDSHLGKSQISSGWLAIATLTSSLVSRHSTCHIGSSSDSGLTSHRSRRAGFGGNEFDHRWPRACIHHAEYRRSRDRLIKECVDGSRSPAIIAWDLHNEPCVAHQGYPCYCVYTREAYRHAVSEEFGQLRPST